MKFLRKHQNTVSITHGNINFLLSGCIFYKTILSNIDLQTFLKIKLQQNCLFLKKIKYLHGENPSLARRLATNNFSYLANLTIKKGFKLKARRFVKVAFKNFFDLFIFCNDAIFIKQYHYFNILKSYAFA